MVESRQPVEYGCQNDHYVGFGVEVAVDGDDRRSPTATRTCRTVVLSEGAGIFDWE